MGGGDAKKYIAQEKNIEQHIFHMCPRNIKKNRARALNDKKRSSNIRRLSGCMRIYAPTKKSNGLPNR
jgi:hypothetical protein